MLSLAAEGDCSSIPFGNVDPRVKQRALHRHAWSGSQRGPKLPTLRQADATAARRVATAFGRSARPLQKSVDYRTV
jgi:hypothetical protein